MVMRIDEITIVQMDFPGPLNLKKKKGHGIIHPGEDRGFAVKGIFLINLRTVMIRNQRFSGHPADQPFSFVLISETTQIHRYQVIGTTVNGILVRIPASKTSF